MLRLLRLLIIFVLAGSFWLLSAAFPDVLSKELLRVLAGLFAALWALEIGLFWKLRDVAGVEGLTSKEHERLVYRLASIRRRIWWIGFIGMLCAGTIVILGESGLPSVSPIYGAMVGMLLGICVSYLILVPVWYNESQSFIDTMQMNQQRKKNREEQLKQMKSG